MGCLPGIVPGEPRIRHKVADKAAYLALTNAVTLFCPLDDRDSALLTPVSG